MVEEMVKMEQRICETEGHKIVPLKKFEQCPVCGSTEPHDIVDMEE